LVQHSTVNAGLWTVWLYHLCQASRDLLSCRCILSHCEL